MAIVRCPKHGPQNPVMTVEGGRRVMICPLCKMVLATLGPASEEGS